jgi:hypothetical protein
MWWKALRWNEVKAGWRYGRTAMAGEAAVEDTECLRAAAAMQSGVRRCEPVDRF